MPRPTWQDNTDNIIPRLSPGRQPSPHASEQFLRLFVLAGPMRILDSELTAPECRRILAPCRARSLPPLVVAGLTIRCEGCGWDMHALSQRPSYTRETVGEPGRMPPTFFCSLTRMAE